MKYPLILFFRHDKYKEIDAVVSKLDNCTVQIVNNNSELEQLYGTNHHILATYGEDVGEYRVEVLSVISNRLRNRWIHFKNIDPEQFVRGTNYCYINNVIKDRTSCRPVFSVFTTCFNSFDKIDRPYSSLKLQTEKDWEWVILDDSTDESHFAFLKKKFANEPKIRLYNRSCNSGSIGNVKNEAIGLCRGKYILELDHDDRILKDVLKDAVSGFDKFPDVGFIYMNFSNIYEGGGNFTYGDFTSKGYAGYYNEKFEGNWIKVRSGSQINNITMSHLYCMPNHPRIWRRELLLSIGSYSEFLPICDDLEVLLRTCYKSKMLKIPKMSYIQYFNKGGNNFSFIRNKEINRLGPKFIVPQSKAFNKFDERFKELGAWEDPKYDKRAVQVWKRTDEPKYCNELFHPDYDLQVCIVGLTFMLETLPLIKELYTNKRNDFFLIDNMGDDNTVISILEKEGLDRMKFYIINEPPATLVRYFKRIYRGIENIKIMGDGLDHDMPTIIVKDLLPNLTLVNMSGKVFDHHAVEKEEQDIANKYIPQDAVVLELGARFGSVSCTINKRLRNKKNQVSVEPDQRVWANLKANKLKNYCDFHILEGAISKRNLNLSFSGYATRSVAASEGTVKTFTLEEVESKYNLRFDTLVADCEGFLEQFFDENPSLYDQLKLVTFEKDFPDKCNYKKIMDRLLSSGFKNLVTGFHEVWQKP